MLQTWSLCSWLLSLLWPASSIFSWLLTLLLYFRQRTSNYKWQDCFISWISSLGNTIKTLNLDGESSIRSREAHYIMSQNYNEETDCQLLNKDVESQQIVEKLQRLKKILLVSIAMFITFIIVVIFVIISSGVEMPETLGKLVEGVCPPGMDWLPDMGHCQLQEEYFQVGSWKIIFP